MGPSSRLFEIIQILRSANAALPARAIAEAVGVTKRTIYRDIATLQGMRIPIEGEAGVGYVMRSGFDLPPLMFTADEVEAISVGLSLLGRTGDAGLQRAALQVRQKIAMVLQSPAGPSLDAARLHVSDWNNIPPSEIAIQVIRKAIRDEQQLHLHYQNADMLNTERVIRPIALAYYVDSIVVAAWCELRQDFRHFRADRIKVCTETGSYFKGEGKILRNAWQARRP